LASLPYHPFNYRKPILYRNRSIEMSKRTLLVFAFSIALSLTLSPFAFAQDETAAPQTGYASVNGLEMYYEIHGTGEPLVVLHGAYASIPLMGELIPRLAETRQVIAPELQGHGRTADIDRPITYEQMADDVAGLLGEIGVEQADIFGYSMGGGVALQVAIRHPELVDRLAVASMPYNTEGYHPGLIDMIKTLTPEMFAGSPPEIDYMSLAPNPENFPLLVEKLVQLDSEVQDWPAEDIQAIESPTLLIFGDSDVIRLEHAVEMFGLRGGGVNGDMTGLPNAQLAVLPATTHIGVMFRVDWVTSMVTEFLDAPLTEDE
jgi:pimeloyl-ACP methyl ester carboxylesterase